MAIPALYLTYDPFLSACLSTIIQSLRDYDSLESVIIKMDSLKYFGVQLFISFSVFGLAEFCKTMSNNVKIITGCSNSEIYTSVNDAAHVI